MKPRGRLVNDASQARKTAPIKCARTNHGDAAALPVARPATGRVFPPAASGPRGVGQDNVIRESDSKPVYRYLPFFTHQVSIGLGFSKFSNGKFEP